MSKYLAAALATFQCPGVGFSSPPVWIKDNVRPDFSFWGHEGRKGTVYETSARFKPSVAEVGATTWPRTTWLSSS